MKEEEIRPQKIFDEYLKLATEDTQTYFGDVSLERGRCPACGSEGHFEFEKSGFKYEECRECHTLFVNPRPNPEAFDRYYTEAPSVEFWATTFYRATEKGRREKLWKPKAKMIRDMLHSFSEQPDKTSVVDIGGGYGLFAEEYRTLTGQSPVVIEPGPSLANACREKDLMVVEKFFEKVSREELPRGPLLFTSFELFEHLFCPEEFLNQVYRAMQAGDLFIFTTLSGSGIDIRGLWEDSKSVSPPHHLNFFNPKSVEHLLGKVGFNLLQVTTPGKLDIDILANNEDLIKDRFLKTFISQASEEERNAFQDFVSSSGLSSHMMVVCRKE